MRAMFAGAALVLVIASAACSDRGGASPGTRTAPSPTAVAASPTPEPPRPPTVVLDPGHGGDEVGAASHGVVEKHSNLDMAVRIERLLQAQGVRVILTRRTDERAATIAGAQPSFGSTRFDLQARVDMANAEEADLFLSIHSNGSTSAGERGVEVWYNPGREFGVQNRQLAESLLANVLRELQAYGYGAVDRGIKDDTCFRERNGRCFPLFLLGPPRTTTREELLRRGIDPGMFGISEGESVATTRATQMPGALVELLFISHPQDAAALADEAARDAMARGVANALLAMLVDA